MPSTVRFVEPHPSVPRTSNISSGRGGIGNYHRQPSFTAANTYTASGPASATPLLKTPRVFTSGRGGAGNVHLSSERAIFSFDEELERMRTTAAPVYHVGRGGAGNSVDERRGSRASVSTGDGGSVRSGFSGASGDSTGGEMVRRSIDWAREMLGRRASERS